MEVVVVDGQKENEKTIHGFLATLQSVRVGTKVISYIPYTKGEYADIAKAIYRMCCIDLIDDFTQDYNNERFRMHHLTKYWVSSKVQIFLLGAK